MALHAVDGGSQIGASSDPSGLEQGAWPAGVPGRRVASRPGAPHGGPAAWGRATSRTAWTRIQERSAACSRSREGSRLFERPGGKSRQAAYIAAGARIGRMKGSGIADSPQPRRPDPGQPRLPRTDEPQSPAGRPLPEAEPQRRPSTDAPGCRARTCASRFWSKPSTPPPGPGWRWREPRRRGRLRRGDGRAPRPPPARGNWRPGWRRAPPPPPGRNGTPTDKPRRPPAEPRGKWPLTRSLRETGQSWPARQAPTERIRGAGRPGASPRRPDPCGS